MSSGYFGGAGALIPFVSETTGLPFRISRDAEVISSIGVAHELRHLRCGRDGPSAARLR